VELPRLTLGRPEVFRFGKPKGRQTCCRITAPPESPRHRRADRRENEALGEEGEHAATGEEIALLFRHLGNECRRSRRRQRQACVNEYLDLVGELDEALVKRSRGDMRSLDALGLEEAVHLLLAGLQPTEALLHRRRHGLRARSNHEER